MDDNNTRVHEEWLVDHYEESAVYLTCWIDEGLYCIPLQKVAQIVGIQGIVPIPEYPDYAKGIINLRGSIIPVIDMRLRFRKEAREYNERTCAIVTDINKRNVGLIVDAVNEVVKINLSSIIEVPKISNHGENKSILGVAKLGQNVALVLDTEKIIDIEELPTLPIDSAI